MEDEPKIVEAVGTSVHSDVPGLGDYLEAAMSEEVHKCIDEGLSLSGDAEEIVRRKLEARDRALEDFNTPKE